MSSNNRLSGVGRKLNIGLVRRGFSSGGAEAYLKRLAAGIAAANHDVVLFTAAEWPADEWNSGRIVRLNAATPIGFADELEKIWRGPRGGFVCAGRGGGWGVGGGGGAGPLRR